MKRILVVALVVVVLFTGIPIVMGMPVMACADCDFGLLLGGACVFAVLAVVAGTALALLAVPMRLRPPVFAGLLLASAHYRPPRLA